MALSNKARARLTSAIAQKTVAKEIADAIDAASSVAPTEIALAQNHVLVGNSSGLAADVAMSGDATIASSGALTIASGAVSSSKLAAGAALANLASASVDATKLAAGAAATNVGSVGGDLTGTLPNPTIGANKVTTAKLNSAGVNVTAPQANSPTGTQTGAMTQLRVFATTVDNGVVTIDTGYAPGSNHAAHLEARFCAMNRSNGDARYGQLYSGMSNVSGSVTAEAGAVDNTSGTSGPGNTAYPQFGISGTNTLTMIFTVITTYTGTLDWVAYLTICEN